MSNKIFSKVILLLFLLGAGILIFPQNDISALENRYLSKTSSDLSTLEDVLDDQLPFRDECLKLIYKIRYILNKSLGNTYVGDMKFNYVSSDVIEIDDQYLIRDIPEYDEDLLTLTEERGYNIKEIDEAYPDIKTYIYLPTRFEETINTYNPLIVNYAADYRNAFLFQLNSDITVKSLELESEQQYQEYFYKTDFHWNNKGAYKGYTDIIEMIQEDFEIDGPRSIKNEACYAYDFNGNLGAKIGKITESDHICDYELEDTDEYTLQINTDKDDEEEYPSEIMEIRKAEYIDHGDEIQMSGYDYYFGDNYFERAYCFYNNKDKPNILVFADSYINVYQTWLASHFYNTIILDMRAQDEDFDLDYLIDKYDIDIILVTQMYNNLYFNGNFFVPLND